MSSSASILIRKAHRARCRLLRGRNKPERRVPCSSLLSGLRSRDSDLALPVPAPEPGFLFLSSRRLSEG